MTRALCVLCVLCVRRQVLSVQIPPGHSVRLASVAGERDELLARIRQLRAQLLVLLLETLRLRPPENDLHEQVGDDDADDDLDRDHGLSPSRALGDAPMTHVVACPQSPASALAISRSSIFGFDEYEMDARRLRSASACAVMIFPRAFMLSMASCFSACS